MEARVSNVYCRLSDITISLTISRTRILAEITRFIFSLRFFRYLEIHSFPFRSIDYIDHIGIYRAVTPSNSNVIPKLLA